jgi:hypothetical protein
MDSGSDGESLLVELQAWLEVFAEEGLSAENREFIERSGKWTAFDVSGEPEYLSLIGAQVEQVLPIRIPDGKIVGAVIETSGGKVRAEVEADDLYVAVQT